MKQILFLNIVYGYVIASGLLLMLNDDPVTQFMGSILMGAGIGSLATHNSKHRNE